MRSMAGSISTMAAVACLTANIPCVGVHTVNPPSRSGRAMTTCGSIGLWWTPALSYVASKTWADVRSAAPASPCLMECTAITLPLVGVPVAFALPPP